MEILDYQRWENFSVVVERAKEACRNSGQEVADHFRDVTKMVTLGSGAEREIGDVAMTRYACYLVAQNGDPRKDAIAFAQTYFAVQTRRQEVLEQRVAEAERIHPLSNWLVLLQTAMHRAFVGARTTQLLQLRAPNNMISLLRSALFALSLTSLPGCDEQQVLYSTASKEAIPPVPEKVVAAAAPAAAETKEGAPPALPAGHPPISGAAGASSLPTPEPANYAAKDLGEELRDTNLQGIAVPVPARYGDNTSTSAMRLAQYAVPAKAGGDAGELVVFYFGKNQGGGVKENVARWAGQFKPVEGQKNALDKFEQAKVGDLTVSRVQLHGTYAASSMMGAGAASGNRDNYGMDALIIEGGPNGNLYLRLTGPLDLVKSEGAVIENMAAKARIADGAAAAASEAAPAAAKPAAEKSAPSAPAEGLAKVDALGVSFAIPAAWQEQKPGSSMRALQFGIPGAKAGEEGEFVLFYFGPTGGGTADDNIARWAGQVAQPDGSKSLDKATISKSTKDSFKITTIHVEGTYAPTPMGPMAPKVEPKEGQALYGIVIEGGPKGNLFLRLTGPAATITANKAAAEQIVATLEKTE
jgi:hypothetical protein